MIDTRELRRLAQAANEHSDDRAEILAEFYAVTQSDTIIEILDRLEEAKTAWKEADKACRDLTEKVIPNLRESLEAAEKDTALKERVIDALGSELNAVANECDALRAKVTEMEQQEPVAWMLNCQTLGGDTGWFLSWTQSGAGMCNRLSGEENEKKLYALPGAKGEKK